MRVWIVEYCDYNPAICCVAMSVEAAVNAVKTIYGPPYIVSWEPARHQTWRHHDQLIEQWHLTGSFEPVEGYSTKHVAHFDITPYDVYEDRAASTNGDQVGEGEKADAVREDVALPIVSIRASV